MLLASSHFSPSYYTAGAHFNLLTFPSFYSCIPQNVETIFRNYPGRVSIFRCLLSEVSLFQGVLEFYGLPMIYLNVVPMQCRSTVPKCSLLLNLPWCTNDVVFSMQDTCM